MLLKVSGKEWPGEKEENQEGAVPVPWRKVSEEEGGRNSVSTSETPRKMKTQERPWHGHQGLQFPGRHPRQEGQTVEPPPCPRGV